MGPWMFGGEVGCGVRPPFTHEKETMDTSTVKPRLQTIGVRAGDICNLTEDLEMWIMLYSIHGYTPPLGNITLHINLN